MKHFLTLISIMLLTSPLITASANAQDTSQKPSLKDTTEWIHDFVEEAGHAADTEFFPGTWHVAFDECAVRIVEDVAGIVDTQRFNLKDIDLNAVQSDDFGGRFNSTFKAAFMVKLGGRNFRPLVAETSGSKNGTGTTNGTHNFTSASLGLSAEAAANRVAKAFRHAIQLCGGKATAY
jgi:hypothetical protein